MLWMDVAVEARLVTVAWQVTVAAILASPLGWHPGLVTCSPNPTYTIEKKKETSIYTMLLKTGYSLKFFLNRKLLQQPMIN